MAVHTLQRIFTAAAVGISLQTGAAAASTLLLDMTGPVGGVALLGSGSVYSTAAASFTVNQDIDNASLGMSLYCQDCAGEVWLISQAPAPDVPGRALEALELFTGPAGRTTSFDLSGILSGLTLFAGTTYTMILEITSGSAGWLSSYSPSYDPTYVTPGTNYISRPANIAFPANYPYADLAGLGYAPLLYSVSGTPAVAPVPLPASAALMLAGLAVLGALRRRIRA